MLVGWAGVFPMNDAPCGTNLPDVCGLPYPFLNDMGAGMRVGFYTAAYLDFVEHSRLGLLEESPLDNTIAYE